MTRKERQQRSNLAKTAIYLLTQSQAKFDMSSFMYPTTDEAEDAMPNSDPDEMSKKHECGTACCFAGHGPLALRNGHCHGSDWNSYTDGTFGTNTYVGSSWFSDNKEDKKFNFLFHGDWPSNKKQTAARALVYLRGGIPDKFAYKKSKYLTNMSEAAIISELETYIYKRNR